MKSLENDFDVIVSGDGEKAIFEALRPNPPQLIDANELHSPLFISREEFNASPFPARHLIDLSSYHYTIDGEPSTSLVAQLGCPFSCGFCGGRESPCLRVVRIRTTGSILQEIESSIPPMAIPDICSTTTNSMSIRTSWNCSKG